MIVLILLISVAVLLLAILWTGVFALDLSIWFAVVPSMLVLLAFGIWGLVKLLKNRKSSKQLEKSIREQSDDSAARPDQMADIAAMKNEFGKALNALRNSKVGSLSTLPWYVIIGPPGAGKSTALRNSGLSFPYLSAKGGAVRGVGGTRHCDWWLTNEAVLLDTAGRYSTQDDDHEEWLSFLETVRRHRPRRPINGILLAISLAELVNASEEQIADLADKLHIRLDEITQHLRSVVPIYLLITKTDLLPGFVETFSDLRKTERGQLWGFTLAGDEPDGPRAAFLERFDELVEVVENRSLWRLGQENRIETRERIFELPQQFSALQDPIGELIDRLFVPSAEQEPPFLRGVFFTSGTQEGRTLDRIMSSMADAFGIKSQMPKPEPVIEAKSYFLRDVFFKVLFPDRQLVRGTRQQQKRKTLTRIGLALGALAFAALLVFPPFVAFLRNRDLVQSIAGAVTTAAPSDTPEIYLERLSPLRERLEELERYAASGPPTGIRFGMYQGDTLLAPTRSIFANAVRDRLLLPLLKDDMQVLAEFSRKYGGTEIPTADEKFINTLGALKMHLLLSYNSQRSPSSEPGLNEAQRQWALERLFTQWKQRSGGSVKSSTETAIQKSIKLYLYLVSLNPDFGLARQDEMVAQSRRALLKAPYEDLVLERILAATANGSYDLTLPSLLGGASPGLHCDRRIRGAFTFKAWDEIIRNKLENSGDEDESWVLGEERGREDRARVETRYYQRYIQEWTGFLEALRIDEPQTMGELLSLFQSLTSGEPTVLSRLWRAVGSNVQLQTALDQKAMSMAGNALKTAVMTKVKSVVGEKNTNLANRMLEDKDRITPEKVQKRFSGFTNFGVPPPSDPKNTAPPGPLGLDKYIEQIIGLRDALQSANDNPTEQPQLVAKLKTARTTIPNLFNNQDTWRTPLLALLWKSLELRLAYIVTGNELCQLAQGWNEVAASYEKLSQGYPFNSSGSDAAMSDVAEFFRPDSGTLWKFVSSLSGHVQRSGDRYVPSREMGGAAGNGISPQFLEFLNRSQELTNDLFGRGQEPAVAMEVLIRPTVEVSAVYFEVDGQQFRFINGPDDWQMMQWPGNGKGSRSSIRVETRRSANEDFTKPGEWSFFRLLESGSARKVNNQIVASWHFKSVGHQLEIFFRPKRSDNPFFRRGESGLFAPFRGRGMDVPRDMVRAGICSP